MREHASVWLMFHAASCTKSSENQVHLQNNTGAVHMNFAEYVEADDNVAIWGEVSLDDAIKEALLVPTPL